MEIVPVEPDQPAPPIPKTFAEIYPTPWKRGEENEAICDIIAANGNKLSIRTNWMSGGTFAGDVAQKFIDVFNAFGGSKK
jgi:hypothetical protein